MTAPVCTAVLQNTGLVNERLTLPEQSDTYPVHGSLPCVCDPQ